MSDKTKIEWTDATWNPVTGCTRVSPGCENCYIDWAPPFRIEGRHFTVRCPRCGGAGGTAQDGGTCTECGGEGLVRSHAIGSTTGVRLHPDRLDQPLRWTKPRRVFVNSLSDLFHDEVSDEYIAQVFAVMALAPQHTFQVLTKRHARMRSLLSSPTFLDQIEWAATGLSIYWAADDLTWPLPNVWLGVTVEDQAHADLRIPALLDTPAAVRFLSCEPLLGPVDLSDYIDAWTDGYCWTCDWGHCPEAATALRRDFTHENPDYVSMLPVCSRHRGIDWVICGGESGKDARPMHPDWARKLRNRCTTAGVPYFFKQWGEWASLKQLPHEVDVKPSTTETVVAGKTVYRVGKRAAGRLLDGRTWDETPGAKA